jgi:predicted DsbA family dithiol-disulfide isomerase
MIIDMFADIACPWCYIGEKRLEQALAQRPDLRAEVRWHPFQLQPGLPKPGEPWVEFTESKFGGSRRAEMAFEHVRQAAEPEGIDFRFDRMTVAPNTEDAHRLVLFAAEIGREWEVVTALFRAHFTEGRNVGDLDTLVEIAAGEGVDPEEVRAYLGSERGRAEVQASQAAAARLGIGGVPFFIFDSRYAISGAQPPEVFLKALDRAAQAA